MAVFLCGVNTVGTLGLAAARHLASHGVSFPEQFVSLPLKQGGFELVSYNR